MITTLAADLMIQSALDSPVVAGAPSAFSAMEANDEWLGFGYLGGRSTCRDEERRRIADAVVYVEAKRAGLTDEQLFEWANSKTGRWAADCLFGSSTPEAGVADMFNHDLAPKAI